MDNLIKLKDFLDNRFEEICSQDFITSDPISIPHTFNLNQDIEISGFLVSILSFGRRSILIAKAKELINIMDNSPYDFIINANEKDLLKLTHFKHRTISSEDIIYIIRFLSKFYKNNDSLELIFSKFLNTDSINIEKSLIGFHNTIFNGQELDFKTRRHLPSPLKGSACKRINMFIRWMVRKDKYNIDFGIWNNIKPSQLICPCDIHVINVANHLKIISQKKSTWKTALELTNNLKLLNKEDPLKYDFALFGTGVNNLNIYE